MNQTIIEGDERGQKMHTVAMTTREWYRDRGGEGANERLVDLIDMMDRLKCGKIDESKTRHEVQVKSVSLLWTNMDASGLIMEFPDKVPHFLYTATSIYLASAPIPLTDGTYQRLLGWYNVSYTHESTVELIYQNWNPINVHTWHDDLVDGLLSHATRVQIHGDLEDEQDYPNIGMDVELFRNGIIRFDKTPRIAAAMLHKLENREWSRIGEYEWEYQDQDATTEE